MERPIAERVAELEWYHTLELPGGVVTPGFFDHRPVLDRYGLPERLDGMRALDVGTFDGFFAFEMERRGATVVALDVDGVEDLDRPAPMVRKEMVSFRPRHPNFDLAAEALGSSVQRRFLSAYRVTPEDVGLFDLVFVGSVLIHLRDPVGALMALHRVCRGSIQIVEEVHRRLDLLSRRVGIAKFQAISDHQTWWIPNRACWAQMLEAAGFVDVTHGDTFVVPFRGHRRGVRHGVLRARPGP